MVVGALLVLAGCGEDAAKPTAVKAVTAATIASSAGDNAVLTGACPELKIYTRADRWSARGRDSSLTPFIVAFGAGSANFAGA